jgi:hypothetical protein
MRDWKGIQRDTAFTDDSPHFVQNARYWVDGELQRRSGLEAYTAQSGIALTNFRTPVGDYFVIFQDALGNLVSVAAT